MLKQLLPTNNDATDLCLQTNMRQISTVLEESPAVSAQIQKILSTLPNLKAFRQALKGLPTASQDPSRLEICNLVVSPWACVGLEMPSLCLGCHTVVDGQEETYQDRRVKISQVY
jgi:hypothetical protein